jgi:heptosyltransferase I
MRVLIIKASALGDISHALPVLDCLKGAFPAIEIDWVVEESFRGLLEGNPQLSELHTVRTRLWRSRLFAADTWRELAKLKETLRSRDYDLVFDLQGDLNSGVICWLTGCADRIGFEKCDAKESLNAMFTTRRIPLRRQDQQATDRCLRLVSVPFAKDYREKRLTSTVCTSSEDDANAEALLATLSDGLVVLFQCGSSWPTKLWSEKSWTELGRALLERFPDATILLPWESEDEHAAVTGIAQGIGVGSRVLDRHTLKGLSALLKRVDLVVGGDSGPLHLAAALGTPTVSFYRATDGRVSAPRGDQHVVVQSPMHCTRCLRIRCDKDSQCRDTVKVDAVLAGVEKLLANP